MSVECPECEMDARSGHAKGCKLAKQRRAKMKRKLTPKQRVLEKYPNAGPCWGYGCAGPTDCVIHRVENGETARSIGRGKNEREAWADAARRLK